MTWLTPPYYTPDPAVRVPCGPFFGSQPTAESQMQEDVRELLSWPQGFMTKAGGSGADSPEQLTDEVINLAKSLTEAPFAKLTASDFDPLVRGAYYANLVIETLKQIPAAPYNWQETGSVYDVWMSGHK